MAFLKQQIHEAFEDDDSNSQCDEHGEPLPPLVLTDRDLEAEDRQARHSCGGNIRPTLFDVCGEEASPKVKKFVKVIMDELQRGPSGEGEGGGFRSMVGNLALEFLKHKLEENDEDYVKPAMKIEVSSTREVHAGSNKGGLPDNGILISGCIG